MSTISSLASLASAKYDDLLAVVDIHDTTMASTGTDKKITVGALLNLTLVAPPTGVAATDTASINTAITAWNTSGRGILQFQVGTYVTNGGHLVGGGSPGAGIIQGTGWNTEIQLANGANAYIFDFGASGSPQFTPGIRIRDIYFNCNGGNQTGDSGAVYARGSVFGVFDHVWFDQPYGAGLRFYQDGLGNYGHHNRITGCLFTNGYVSASFGQAIRFDHCDENSMTGCTFQDNGTSTYPSAQVYDTQAGLQTFTGCSFVTTRATSVTMIKSDSSPSRMKIVACDFDSSTTGNQLELNGDGSSVNNCQFLNFGSTGNLAVHLSNSRCRITGNSFYASGTTGIAVSEDTGVGADYNLILGNSFAGTYSGGTPYVTHGTHTVAANNITG